MATSGRENLDQADHFQIGPQRPEDQEATGGVRRLLFAEAGVRRDDQAVAGHDVRIVQHLVEQAAMLLLLRLAFQQARMLEIHLVLEGQLVVFARRPDDPSDGCQS